MYYKIQSYSEINQNLLKPSTDAEKKNRNVLFTILAVIAIFALVAFFILESF